MHRCRMTVSALLVSVLLRGLSGSVPLLTSIITVLATVTTVAQAESSATAKLQEIINDHWEFSVQEDPVTAGRMGITGFNDRLPGVTPADRARRLFRERQFLQQLASVDTSELSDSELINHQMLGWVLRNSIEANELFSERIPANTFYSFWSLALDASSGLLMTNVQDYQDYINRIKDFGRYFDENISNMQAGIKDRFVLPKIVVQGIAPTVRAQVYSDPTRSSLFEPFKKLPVTISKVEQQALQDAAKAAISQVAMPAFARLADFLEGDYLKAARDSLAAEQLPNGKAYYRHNIRTYVTADIDPEQIHTTGQAEVTRIRAEMDALIKEIGFKGSFKDFTTFLRTDPQFYAKTPQELLKEASYIAKRIDYRLPEFFGKLPRIPYGVVPVPAEIAPNYTTASYNPAAIGSTHGGTYWLNTYALDQRPLYELVALTLHEAVPGHHLQTAISLELENVPQFRRNLYLSAFGEGWGLYAERLGVDMGVYDNAYQHFGRLSYEMWRACRLVIDTGIHTMGWSRQQALDFLTDNTALSQANVRAEVDRYISWPGQALAYKMGEIKIRQLRSKAERELGPKFDLRAFHDALLANGAIPLEILEAEIDRFIAAAKLKVKN